MAQPLCRGAGRCRGTSLCLLKGIFVKRSLQLACDPFPPDSPTSPDVPRAPTPRGAALTDAARGPCAEPGPGTARTLLPLPPAPWHGTRSRPPSLPETAGLRQPSVQGLGHRVACGDQPEPQGQSAAADAPGPVPGVTGRCGAHPGVQPWPRAQPPTPAPRGSATPQTSLYSLQTPATLQRRAPPFLFPVYIAPAAPAPRPRPVQSSLHRCTGFFLTATPCAGCRRAGWRWPILYASKV